MSNTQDSMNCISLGVCMKSILEDIREKLSRGNYLNEEHVRLCIVSRLLQALDWNIWDPCEVNAEFVPNPDEDRTRIDFALFHSLDPDVFIEIKPVAKLETGLSGAEKQLRDYNRNNTATFSVITDGNIWRLYYSQSGGQFSDKCFKTINVSQDNLDDVELYFATFYQKKQFVVVRLRGTLRTI